jgi:HlyD family secretion protein
VVTEIVAEVGEAIGAGQPVIAIEKSDEQWLSFVPEDFLNGLTVGSRVSVQRKARRK